MYEFEGSIPPSFDDEFSVPDNYSMEDIKYRVRNWQASPTGADYVIEVVSERHIILTKSKHDMKICCVGCVVEFISTIVIVAFIFGTVGYDYNALMNAMAGVFGVIGVIMAIFVGLFCLRPEKAVFEMRFGNEMPIKVQIQRSGELQKSAHEYASLKSELHGDSQSGGPDLSF